MFTFFYFFYISVCRQTGTGNQNAGCTFKVCYRLFILLTHRLRHLYFRFFTVQPVTSSVKTNEVRLTYVRNKN